jgi:hypothetical protein
MRVLVVLFGAFMLFCYVMVIAGCDAPATAAPREPASVSVQRSFAGCTAEPDGRQQCCYTAEGREPICVFVAAPRRASRVSGARYAASASPKGW